MNILKHMHVVFYADGMWRKRMRGSVQMPFDISMNVKKKDSHIFGNTIKLLHISKLYIIFDVLKKENTEQLMQAFSINFCCCFYTYWIDKSSSCVST